MGARAALRASLAAAAFATLDAAYAAYSLVGETALSGINGTVVTYGDWDSDHNTDVFVTDHWEGGVNLTVISGAALGTGDQPSSGGSVGTPVLANARIGAGSVSIENVIAGDFDYDGLLDVLVQHTAPSADGEVTNVVYLDRLRTAVQLPSTTNHFLAANLFGQLHIDLVATVRIHLDGGKTAERTAVLENTASGSAAVAFRCHVDTAGLPQGINIPGCKHVVDASDSPLEPWLKYTLAAPAESATVDLDGDCRADLVLAVSPEDAGAAAAPAARVLKFVQMQASHDAPFQAFQGSPSELKVAPEIGCITWHDIDTDGDVDIIAPFCTFRNKTRCVDADTGDSVYDSILVVKNQQADPGCPGYQCCSPKNPGFGFADISTQEAALRSDAVVVSTIAGAAGLADTRMIARPAHGGLPRVRVGSLDNEAEPDVILGLKSQAGDYTLPGDYVVTLDQDKGGSFTSMPDQFEFPRMDGVVPTVASFFDIGEDGTLDICIVTADAEGRQRIQLYKKNVEHANRLFLKTLGLNGLCMHDCPNMKSDPNRYGVNQPGVLNKIFWKGSDGGDRFAASTQLPQSQHLALTLPYSFFPLGNTNNYIEVYFSGYHILDAPAAYSSWLALLPNSQVVVINYPPDSPEKWTLEMLVTPSRFTKWIIITMSVTLALLVIPIFVLRRREMKEDVLESRDHRAFLPM